jgi:hypothetical protein
LTRLLIALAWLAPSLRWFARKWPHYRLRLLTRFLIGLIILNVAEFALSLLLLFSRVISLISLCSRLIGGKPFGVAAVGVARSPTRTTTSLTAASLIGVARLHSLRLFVPVLVILLGLLLCSGASRVVESWFSRRYLSGKSLLDLSLRLALARLTEHESPRNLLLVQLLLSLHLESVDSHGEGWPLV